jgi:zinc protease
MQRIFLFFIISHSFFCNALQVPVIYKKKLENGLTVLVCPTGTMQKVSVQLWYNIGSKDENVKEKGLAHFIEHMIFKGTENLSESDIPEIAKILSGNVNAFTSYDTTHYLFNLPPAYWKESLPLIADCMRNCTFKEDLLNAELKAVIAEMKMYHDNYKRILVQKLIGSLFPDHPYHYPIIGYKQDLWNLSRENLHEFYHKHYLPNNATLVIVGNVDTQEAAQLVEKYFASIEPNFSYEKNPAYLTPDIGANNIMLYRDVQVPYAILGWVIPGFSKKMHPAISVTHNALTGGKMGRLHKLLVDDLQLVTSIGSSSLGLFDHDAFLVSFEPKNIDDLGLIMQHIQHEIATVAQNGLTAQELERICKQYTTEQLDMLEDNYDQATLIAKSYLSLEDEYYPYTDHWSDRSALNVNVKDLVKNYLRPSLMHTAVLVPFDKGDQEYWAALQQQSDDEDAQLLQGKVRESEVEPVKYAAQLAVSPIMQADYPKPEQFTLSNGIQVFYYQRASLPKISASIRFKADELYDSESLPGLYRILCMMLFEGGTKNHSAQEIAELIESNAIGLSISPGSVDLNALKEDFGTALQLSAELLTQPLFDGQALEKVRSWARQSYKHFLQSPSAIAQQTIKEKIFPHHPNSKNILGNAVSIEKITSEDLIDFHTKFISPHEAAISIVGDFEDIDLKEMLENTLGKWQGPKIKDLEVNEPKSIEPKELAITMQRDQTVLAFAGLSVARNHPDFDKLLLFDQLFGNGIGSKLFELREKTGAFYSIRGTLLSGTGKHPGMFLVHTLVSNDRLQEAQDLICHAIDFAIDTVTPQELEAAKRRVLLAPDDFYSTNSSIANIFLFLHEYGLPWDYFSKRIATINALELMEVKEAVKKILRSDAIIMLKVGRVNQ